MFGCILGQSPSITRELRGTAHAYQCDQMARLVVQFLVVYNNENLPNRMKIAKEGSKFLPMLNETNVKILQNVAKVALFCHIWSH